MKRGLKIAAGVGVVAVIVCGVVLLKHSGDDGQLSSGMSSAGADNIVSRLTPEVVIVRCGAPWSDRVQNVSDAAQNRVMAYDLPATVGRVELTFSGEALALMEVKDGGSERIVSDSEERLEALPCLASGAAADTSAAP